MPAHQTALHLHHTTHQLVNYQLVITGNAAEDGRAATVFARLKVPDPNGGPKLVDHGVHAFVVPLRDANGNCLPGVEIRDCGYKVSWGASGSVCE